jgi:alkanesulfonate monooxygenase SsuD/methylene tetrahydromethanopterin reductase-like flavin-dependent oxidoreductase (luciferase family)
MMVSVGLGIPTYGVFPDDPWTFLRTLAEVADGGGIDTVWVADHLTLPEDDVRANGGRTRVDEPLDAWTVLAMVAATTSRLRVGTEVTPVPLRHPVLLAQTVATLDALSSGRAALGIGAGWYRDEFEEAGIVFRPYRQRLEQTREGVELLRSLLEGEIVWTSGVHYEPSGACVRTEPGNPRVPIWFGGRSEHVLRLAADLGEGWITATNASPDEVEQGQTRLRELVTEAGRSPCRSSLGSPGRRSRLGPISTRTSSGAPSRGSRRSSSRTRLSRTASGARPRSASASSLPTWLWASITSSSTSAHPTMRSTRPSASAAS